jgi:nucleoid-associated protein YgaU
MPKMPGEDELRVAQTKLKDALKEFLAALGTAVPLRDVSVTPGDTLWALAVQHLGDGQRWREIYMMNLDVMYRHQASHNSPPTYQLIYPGQTLRVMAI